jgi:hypothetical protein
MLKLNEIININENTENSILIESIYRYKKSLITYYSAYFDSEPVLMVTSVNDTYVSIGCHKILIEDLRKIFGD